MKYLGTKEELIDNGFTYVEQLNSYIRPCKYTRDEQTHDDVFYVHAKTHDVCVDIPKYCTNDVYKEVAADLLKKGLLEEGPIAREPSVRAKFECISIWPQENGEMIHIGFTPVMDGSEENKMFGDATASGTISMGIDPAFTQAAGAFVVGSEYYVDFTKVEKQEVK